MEEEQELTNTQFFLATIFFWFGALDESFHSSFASIEWPCHETKREHKFS
jgi:hypothetical protein